MDVMKFQQIINKSQRDVALFKICCHIFCVGGIPEVNSENPRTELFLVHFEFFAVKGLQLTHDICIHRSMFFTLKFEHF